MGTTCYSSPLPIPSCSTVSEINIRREHFERDSRKWKCSEIECFPCTQSSGEKKGMREEGGDRQTERQRGNHFQKATFKGNS